MRSLGYRVKPLLGFALVIAVAAPISSEAGFSFISRTVMTDAMLRAERELLKTTAREAARP